MPADNPESRYVLTATYSSGPLAGHPQYFRFCTAIGPCATPDLSEAERFDSAQAAMASPAFTHWSSFYEPKLVSECTTKAEAA